MKELARHDIADHGRHDSRNKYIQQDLRQVHVLLLRLPSDIPDPDML